MGLVSALSLAHDSDSESFLVVHALFSQDGCQQGGYWDVLGHVVSPFDLSRALPVRGGLLVPCSLPGPLVLTHADGYYGAWAEWAVSVSVLPLTVSSFLLIYLFIFGCAWSSLLLRLFSSCGEQKLLSSCSTRASHFYGFSCCRAWALGYVGFSSYSSRALKHRLSSCGAWV